MIETEEQMGGRRLAPGETFCFACRAELACFNSCCRNKRLPLWPYDVLRLRLGLGLDSSEVLARHGELEFDPNSGWPALRLRLDDQGRCPLLGPQGCTVYAHRPAACRVYPLAWALAPGADGGRGREIFLRQKTPGCLGWTQDREHTTASWVEDQGLADYLEANSRFLDLWFHPGRRGRLKLSGPQTHAVIAALYNLDVFRRMAADPAFLQDAGLDPARAARAAHDDLELLLLGRDWLMARLFPTRPAA